MFCELITLNCPQSSLYIKHLSTSNIPLSQTFLFLEHISIKHLFLSNNSFSQTTLSIKQLFLSNNSGRVIKALGLESKGPSVMASVIENANHC